MSPRRHRPANARRGEPGLGVPLPPGRWRLALLPQLSNLSVFAHDQHLVANRSAEIALARSAAPPSISDEAGVMVLGARGFETVVKGTNGFVCLVERAWDKPFDDPEFWNPKVRAPICLNAAAVRTALPTYLKRAKWVGTGRSKNEMEERSKTSSNATMKPAAGAMSFMMSKQQYLSDTDGYWYPHIMFFSPHAAPVEWGANLRGSPVLATDDAGPVTMFFVPVRKWSDGTLADYGSPAVARDHDHR